MGVVEVPDERVKNWRNFPSLKSSAGRDGIRGYRRFGERRAEGEGLGNKFLSHIREVDAIAEVVRVLTTKIIHVHNKVEPLNDVGVVETGADLADLETVNKRVGAFEKEAKFGDKEIIKN